MLRITKKSIHCLCWFEICIIIEWSKTRTLSDSCPKWQSHNLDKYRIEDQRSIGHVHTDNFVIEPKINQECSPKMCTANNVMPFFVVTLTVFVFLQYYFTYFFGFLILSVAISLFLLTTFLGSCMDGEDIRKNSGGL